MPTAKVLWLGAVLALMACTPETAYQSSTSSNASTAQRAAKSATSGAGAGGKGGSAAAGVGATLAPPPANMISDQLMSATAYLEGFREPTAGSAADGGGGAGAGGSEGAGAGGAGGRGGSGGAGGSSTMTGRNRGPTLPPIGNRRNGATGGAGAGGKGGAGAGGGGAGGVGGAGAGGAGGAAGAGGKPAMDDSPSEVTASAVFMPRGDGIQVGIAISKCESGKSYPVSIQDGTGCAGEMMQGKVWDAPRGAGIPDVPCDGSTLMYTRSASDPKPWSIGAPMTSNVVGRLLVMYDPADHEKPIICGAIHSP